MIRPQAMNVSKKNKLTTIIRPCFKWKVYFFFQAIRYLLEENEHFVKPVLFLEKNFNGNREVFFKVFQKVQNCQNFIKFSMIPFHRFFLDFLLKE